MAPAPKSVEFICTRRIESSFWRRGFRLVAGCDEAGRGALIGPVYAAAVILDPARRIAGVDDSKKLTPEERRELDAAIRTGVVAFSVASATAAEVDALNIFQAARLAMIRALTALIPVPEFVLTDAMRLSGWGDANEFSIPYRSIIHGDARCASIGAASILAKVARDAHMEMMDSLYPEYQLARNKGYCTPEHLEGLERHGPCPEHRRSFDPVKSYYLPLFPYRPEASAASHSS